jgi:serine/threonine-protein kinase
MIGKVLGSYRIVRELSSGGQGTVYEAKHELLERVAAVKLLRPELTENTELVQRFFNEAKAATAIHHPGIIEVYDFGYTPDGIAYLVMELLRGEPLSKLIARGPVAEGDAVQIARGIAGALAAAHDKGIVHRDLKPDNVFLVPDPDVPLGVRPKVLDFGVAKLGDMLPRELRHTVTGALMGTPLYMAPEQARAAGQIDQRADLYSLGCILYEMLAGRPPFVAQGAGEIIALHLFQQPEPIGCSSDVEAIAKKLLEKEPEARFASAGELVQVLGGVLGGMNIRTSARHDATPLPSPPTGARRVAPMPLPTMEVAAHEPRSRLPIIAGALTVALATAAVLLVSRSGHHTAPPAPPPPAPVAAQPAPQPAPPPAAKIDEPVVEQLPATQLPSAPKKPVKPHKGPTTANGSPYEPDL